MEQKYGGLSIVVSESTNWAHVARIYDNNVLVSEVFSLNGEMAAMKAAKARIKVVEDKGTVVGLTEILPILRVKDLLKFRRAVEKRRAKNKLTRRSRRANRV